MTKGFSPVEMEEGDKPDKDNAPEVALRFNAPEERVNPFAAVKLLFTSVVPLEEPILRFVAPWAKFTVEAPEFNKLKAVAVVVNFRR
jgi:hypothetical protein